MWHNSGNVQSLEAKNCAPSPAVTKCRVLRRDAERDVHHAGWHARAYGIRIADGELFRLGDDVKACIWSRCTFFREVPHSRSAARDVLGGGGEQCGRCKNGTRQARGRRRVRYPAICSSVCGENGNGRGPESYMGGKGGRWIRGRMFFACAIGGPGILFLWPRCRGWEVESVWRPRAGNMRCEVGGLGGMMGG